MQMAQVLKAVVNISIPDHRKELSGLQSETVPINVTAI